MPHVTPLPLMVALAAIIAGAGACQRQEPQPARKTAPVTTAQQNHLWRIEVMQDGRSLSQVEVCADHAIEASFSRPVPFIQGQECVHVDEAVETHATYSVRCRTGDQLYRVGSVTTGDRARDFTVEMAVSRQDAKGPSFEQVRRYKQIGPCPVDWKIGDSAAPGQTQVVNTLSGERRTVARRP